MSFSYSLLDNCLKKQCTRKPITETKYFNNVKVCKINRYLNSKHFGQTQKVWRKVEYSRDDITKINSYNSNRKIFDFQICL